MYLKITKKLQNKYNSLKVFYIANEIMICKEMVTSIYNQFLKLRNCKIFIYNLPNKNIKINIKGKISG